MGLSAEATIAIVGVIVTVPPTIAVFGIFFRNLAMVSDIPQR